MKPTIEEVKQHFKNAKEVKDRWDIAIINIETIRYDRCNNGIIVCDSNSPHRITELYRKGFAEIISYKTPKLEIDKDLILKIADKCPSCKDDLKKEFPSVFEVKLEVGKWYKGIGTDMDGALVFLKEFNSRNNYGFRCFDKGWSYEWQVSNPKKWTLATPSEILSALTKEAEKRGLVEGATIINHQGTFKLDKLNIVYSERYNNGIYTRQGEGIWLFINGTWATPIQTVTQKELLDHYKETKGITNEIIVEG